MQMWAMTLSEMNIFAVARWRDNKYKFFAYVMSQKRCKLQQNHIQSIV